MFDKQLLKCSIELNNHVRLFYLLDECAPNIQRMSEIILLCGLYESVPLSFQLVDCPFTVINRTVPTTGPICPQLCREDIADVFGYGCKVRVLLNTLVSVFRKKIPV